MSNLSRAPSPATETSNGASAPTARRASLSRSSSSGAGTAEKSAVGSVMDDSALLKEDSEAETIIQSGREELSPEKKRKKVIKHERDPSEERKILESAEQEEPPSSDVKVRKRKRADEPGQDAYPSSPRSSLLSSPGPLPSSDRAGSETTSTRHPSPSTERRKLKNEARSKMRLSDGEWHDNDEHTRRVRRHVSPSSRQEGRDVRSATYMRHSSGDRSPSPRSRTHQRVFSAQSSLPSFRKKRVPPPLNTSKKRHLSEDRRSRSSSASDSPAPTSHARRFVSGESSANSPAKSMAPMPRKIKDQSGRTWLARACASSDFDAVKQRLEERPDDLNVSDHAGNTPLQIAALEGHVRIVRFLLDRGSDPNTKNCDEDTPLIDAVENDHTKVVKLLLDHGANPRQPNAQGEEPYELATEDSEVRKLLSDALKRSDTRRRKSNAGSTQLYSAASPRDSPPVDGPRLAPNARRKAHRAETRNDFLWIQATPEKLREFAAKGDTQAVGHILQIMTSADTASVIAAAKGGHEEVLGLLLGMGNPKPDPLPLRTGLYRDGFNTPMLAAIGRGNNKVIKLLLEQTDFNPTRTINNKTYYELSEERKGDDWEKEYELLKDAFERYSSTKKKNRKKESHSPRQSREKEKATKSSSRLKSESPAAVNRKQHPTVPNRKSESRPKGTPSNELKRDSSTGIKEKPLSGATESIKRSRLTDGNTSDHSVAVTDQEAEPLGPPKAKAAVPRRKSDASLRNADDKRGRLLSGKARKEQEKTRRASIMSSDSVSSKEDALKSRPDLLHLKDKSALKRTRQSQSPERSRSRDPDHKRPEDIQKKRRRVDNDESNPPKLDKERSKSHATTDSTRGIARKVSKPAAVEQPPPEKKRSHVGSVFENYRKSQQASEKAEKSEKTDKTDKTDKTEKAEKPEKSDKLEKPEPTATTQTVSSKTEDVEMEEPKKTVSKTSEAESKEALKAQAAQREKAQAAQREKAKAEERAAEEKRQAELEKAKIAAEKAAEEAKKKAELEAKEAAILREKELAAEKKRQEEELERQRKAELEEAETRRRQKLEEEQRFLEEKRLEEERQEAELQRQEALPNTLRVSAQLIHSGNPEARERSFLGRFNTLYTATTGQLCPGASPKVAEDKWMPNFQAVLLLAITDLKLRQFNDWEKLPVTKLQKARMWACCNRPLSQPYRPNPLDGMGPIVAQAEEAMHKFNAMADDDVFWIKLENFLAIVPEFPHLAGLKLKQMEMHIDKEGGADDQEDSKDSKPTDAQAGDDAPKPYAMIDAMQDQMAAAVEALANGHGNGNGNGNGNHMMNGYAVTNGYHDDEH